MNTTQAKDAVTALYEWSLNYDYPSPMTLYLDIIGYSEDEYGEKLCQEKSPSIGYLEADLLGKALIAYSDVPGECLDTVQELLTKEMNGDD